MFAVCRAGAGVAPPGPVLGWPGAGAGGHHDLHAGVSAPPRHQEEDGGRGAGPRQAQGHLQGGGQVGRCGQAILYFTPARQYLTLYLLGNTLLYTCPAIPYFVQQGNEGYVCPGP